MIELAVRRLRVLVVEDHEHLGEVLVEMVEHVGHEARVLRDGRAALVGWSDPAPPDLALIDLRLPYVDGFELARRLRSLGVGAPLVAISGSLERDVPERCERAGFDEHLLKPVEPAILERLLLG